MPAEPDNYRLGLDYRAVGLGYRHGSDTLLVLLDLAAHATDSREGIVVSASYREIARRLGVSKDTVGRRMAVLRGDNAGSGSGVVLLSGECRPLRRALRPLVWVVLEEVALDAVVEDGSLVARTSARHVAERLGVNPSTAAEALRVLGRRGLVGLERE